VKKAGVKPANKALAAVLRAKSEAANLAAAKSEIIGSHNMPGSCPYDNVVLSGKMTFSDAKTRHELLYISTQKIKQAEIETQQAELALELRKIEIEKARGKVVAVEYCEERQHTLITCMLDLLHMVVAESAATIAQDARKKTIDDVTRKYQASLAAAADSLTNGSELGDIMLVMQRAFRGEK